MKEASINAKEAGERGISAKSVKKVTPVRMPIIVLTTHADWMFYSFLCRSSRAEHNGQMTWRTSTQTTHNAMSKAIEDQATPCLAHFAIIRRRTLT
jgi:hypothetical protein